MNQNRGRGKKRKAMDEKILAKARKHIQHEPNVDHDDDDDDDEEDNEPLPEVTDEEMSRMLNPEPDADVPVTKKIRKPRHTEKKPKPEVPESPEKKTKKKKKKKKKSSTDAVQPGVKTTESIERHSSNALDFLQKWKHCRSDWKFEKLKQVWLLQNCLNPDLVPESIFPVLLEYMGSVKGQARVATEKEMNSAMTAFEIIQNPSDASTLKYERARQILQMLSSD